MMATDEADLLQPLLAPVECIDGGSGGGADGGGPGCNSLGLPLAFEPRRQRLQHAPGMQYYQVYLRMAAWLAVLFCGYAVQRAACQAGLPHDGLRQVSWARLGLGGCWRAPCQRLHLVGGGGAR